MKLNTILHLFPFIAGVYAVCGFTEDTSAPIRHLSDLRTATPFTFIDTYTESGCAATPTTATVYYTLNVAGTTYPALSQETYVLKRATGTGVATWVFPGFTVTRFTPGEQATVTWSAVHGASTVSSSFFFFVPTSITLTALPTNPTSTILSPSSTITSQTSTITSQTSTILSQTSTILSQTSTQSTTTTNSSVPQTSTSTPIGAIVGGIIAGLVLITAILAFTWYKVSTRQQMLALHDEPFYYETGKPIIPRNRAEHNEDIQTEEYEMGRAGTPRDVPIKYPEVSANIAGDY